MDYIFTFWAWAFAIGIGIVLLFLPLILVITFCGHCQNPDVRRHRLVQRYGIDFCRRNYDWGEEYYQTYYKDKAAVIQEINE